MNYIIPVLILQVALQKHFSNTGYTIEITT